MADVVLFLNNSGIREDDSPTGTGDTLDSTLRTLSQEKPGFEIQEKGGDGALDEGAGITKQYDGSYGVVSGLDRKTGGISLYSKS